MGCAQEGLFRDVEWFMSLEEQNLLSFLKNFFEKLRYFHGIGTIESS